MAINFPNSPNLNELYSYDNKTWEWNGIYWEVYSGLTSYITSAYTVGNGYSVISGVTDGDIALKSFSGVNITIINDGDKLTFSGSQQQNVSGFYLPLSGGTVTGPTIFTNGLTANTISATTYQNLPIDIRVTGATKSGSVATFRNNTGGTFTLTGLTDTFVTGGTYSSSTGVTTFRNNTGGTFSISGYFTPSNDIYVNGGTFYHGPSSTNNDLVLNRSDSSTITISDLVNISDTTKQDMDVIISQRNVIRGKTYKISGCDSSLYDNGEDGERRPVYTTIYLLGLEGNKLSESGIGIFYTPKYSEIPIFIEEFGYSTNDVVIWGGYVWICIEGDKYNSIDIFTLDPIGFQIIYPFDRDNEYNSSLYNIQYDDIIYDYDNDRIIYRQEQGTNIVQTSYANIQYWIDRIGYNPIRVFQWGNVYDFIRPRGIGNQIIIDSYNENINYSGRYQINLYFKNYSYQRSLTSEDPDESYQDSITLENYSYIENILLGKSSHQFKISLRNESFISLIQLGDASYQAFITLENNSYIESLDMTDGSSYQSKITLTNGSYIINGVIKNNSYQVNLFFDNGSYMNSFTLYNLALQNNLNFKNRSFQNNIILQTGGTEQSYFSFDNGSYQDSITLNSSRQQYLNFDNGYQSSITANTQDQEGIYIENGSQTNGLTFTQTNITIKGYNLDWSTYSSISPQSNLFFIHDLPSETPTTLIGKKQNRLVEMSLPVDVFVTGATKSGSVATFTNNTGGTFTLTGLTDTFVTGGTYTGSTLIFTNNTGGTFNVTGITTSSAFTGGTVSGATVFTGGLTADTISATTITSPSISPYGLIVATSYGYQNIF